MAQAVKIDVAEAMKMGLKLPLASQKNQQYVVVPAKDLTRADSQAWKFNGDTAEFLGGNPQVDGTYCTTDLSKGLIYEVFYYMTMKDHQESSCVELILLLPDGNKQDTKVTITLCPQEWQAISVGKFINMFKAGDIKFSFLGDTGDTWKGLLLQCVVITPSF